MKLRIVYSLLTTCVLSAIVLSWATQDSVSRDYEFYTVLASSSEQIPDVTMPGTVMGVEEVPVFAKASGSVSKVFVRPGQIVKEGDLLVGLDGSSEDIAMYTSLVDIRKELSATKKLRTALRQLRQISNVTAVEATRRVMLEAEVLRVIKDYLTYDSLLDEFKRRSVDKFLIAPRDGQVVALNARPGDRVDALRQEFPLATIAPPLVPGVKLMVRLEVPEEVVHRVRKGQPVAVHLPFSSRDSVAAEISDLSSVALTVDKNRFFPATAKIEPQEMVSDLRYGMRIMADVRVAETQGGIWIPTSALDLKIPPALVQGGFTPGARGGRSQLAGNAPPEASPEKALGPISRSLSTELTPKDESLREIYLLTSSSMIVKATVSVLARNDRQTLISAPELEGARVVTHFRRKTRSALSLLGN